MTVVEANVAPNFIRNIIDEDRKVGKHQGKVVTRFPPEPNGYLHIGHAKSICLNFGLALDYQGVCHMRFDDTNPAKEDVEYVNSIMDDIRWLGFDWADKLFYASDYFEHMYECAVQLIQDGKAYVDSLTAEEIRQHRGTLTEPGKNSPYRDRSVDENLALFQKMKNGDMEEGSAVLRAKIDMASPNINMRDPAMYRIKHAHHHRTGDKWHIYPMYDYAHCLSDEVEGITHSICTLEFENHRPLYDWFLDQLQTKCHPQQIEFARLNLTHTVMSKRKLLQLVNEKRVHGWDDPRMPTIAGMRRRGYTPEAIRKFAETIGVAKAEGWIDLFMLEEAVRDDLNPKVARVMGVLRPLKVVIEDFPEGKVEEVDAPYFPDDPPKMGDRKVPFTRTIYIERDDFMEDPPKKFFRLSPGTEVRLRRAYVVKCTSVVKNEAGEVVEVRCTHDPDTLGANPSDGRKIKGTIHWVSAEKGLPVEIRVYDRLSLEDKPGADRDVDFLTTLNPHSLEVLQGWVEPSLAGAAAMSRYQFERQGYFCVDPDSKPDRLVFNRIVSLRDGWAKLVQAGKAN